MLRKGRFKKVLEFLVGKLKVKDFLSVTSYARETNDPGGGKDGWGRGQKTSRSFFLKLEAFLFSFHVYFIMC